jgi:hypothetical protein
MFIGKPVLYIGPEPSHITEILHGIDGNIMVNTDHGDRLVEKLLAFKSLSPGELERIGNQNRMIAETHFNPKKLKSAMVAILAEMESYQPGNDKN